MIFIRTTLQGSMIMVLNYYLKTHTLQFLKLKQLTCMKIFMGTRNCLILAITLQICNFMILFIKKAISKMKDEVRGNTIDELD